MRKFSITQSNRNGVSTTTIVADGFLEREKDGSHIFFTRSIDASYPLPGTINRVGLFYDVEEITSAEIEDDQCEVNFDG